MVCHTECFQRMERTMAIKGPYMLHCPSCRKVLMYEESNEAKIHQAVAIRCSQEEDEVEVEEGDWVQEEYNRVDRSVRQGITTYGGVCDVDAPPPHTEDGTLQLYATGWTQSQHGGPATIL
jgi:uncharacterized protein YbaR (Trm112 family)